MIPLMILSMLTILMHTKALEGSGTPRDRSAVRKYQRGLTKKQRGYDPIKMREYNRQYADERRNFRNSPDFQALSGTMSFGDQRVENPDFQQCCGTISFDTPQESTERVKKKRKKNERERDEDTQFINEIFNADNFVAPVK